MPGIGAVRQRDFHRGVALEKRQRVEVKRGVVGAFAGEVDIEAVSEAAGEYAALEFPEMQREIAGGTVVAVSVELTP